MPHSEKWKKSWKKPKILHNKLTKYNFLVAYPENLRLGKYVDIGQFTYIQAQYGVVLEDDVEIGGGCMIYSCSTIDNKQGKITIKKGAKIGANSTIMPSCILKSGSLLAAHSFLKSGSIIEENEIWAGVPAKKIGEMKDEKRTY